MATRTEVFRAAIDSRAATLGAQQFEAATRRMGAGARRAANDIQRADVAMKSTARSAALVASRLAGFAALVGGGVGLRSAVNTIVDFDRAMSNLRVVTGATNRELRLLEAQARRLGGTTAFTASQAASAQTFLGRAGFRAGQIRAATPSTLNLAQLAEIDLGTSADIASNVLSQFNLQAEETSRVVDVLANTANSSNTNILQLSEAMKFAGPISGQLGRSIEETAAAIGVLGNSGIQASLAGTNLRGILLSLIDPSNEAKSAIRSLGLSLDQLDPSRRSLADIFAALQGVDPRSANIIFGRRNVGGLLTLARGAGAVSELEAANLGAAGTGARGASQLASDLRGSVDAFKSAIESIVLSTGSEGLGGALKRTVDGLTDFVRLLDQSVPAMKAFVEAASLGASARFGAVSEAVASGQGIGAALERFRQTGDAAAFVEDVQGVLGVSGPRTLSGADIRQIQRDIADLEAGRPTQLQRTLAEHQARNQAALPQGRLGPALPAGLLPPDAAGQPTPPLIGPTLPRRSIPGGRLGPAVPGQILDAGTSLIGPPEAVNGVNRVVEQLNQKISTQGTLLTALGQEWRRYADFATSANVAVGDTLQAGLFGIEDALVRVRRGTRDWGEAFEDVGNDILDQIQRILTRMALVNIIQGVGSGISSLAGGGGFSAFLLGAGVPAQHGFEGVVSGPSSGFPAPFTLHGTERVKIEPMGQEGGSGRAVNMTFNTTIVAADAESFDEKVVGTLERRQRQFATAMLNEISGDDGMADTVRRL